MKYYVYCRKSSEDADRQVQSIDDQKKVMQDIARSKGIKIIKIFEESQSAKSPGRPVFSAMLEGIHKGEAQGILTWKLDRLARNPIDGGNIIWMLQTGILQQIVTSDRTYYPTDNVLMMSVEFGMANQFILDLSKNTKRGMKGKSEKGWKPGMAPLGYLNDRLEKTIIKDEERFGLVRKIWDLMLTGAYTPLRIAEIAQKEWKLTTVKRKKSGGNLVSLNTIYFILRNPFYYGEFGNAGEIYQGKHEPMITKSEFDRVQMLLGKKGNPRPSKKTFPLTGLIECGECSCSITAEDKNRYSKKQGLMIHHTYYHCTKKRKHSDGYRCSQKCIEDVELEKQITNYLKKLEISDRFLEWTKKWLANQTNQEIDDRETIQKNLEDSFKKLSKKLDSLIQLKISEPDLLSDEEFKSHKNSIIAEKQEVERQLKHLSERQNDWVDMAYKLLSFCQKAKVKFETGTDQEKRLILACIGSKLVLTNGKLNIEAKNPFLVVEKYSEMIGDISGGFEQAKSRKDMPKIPASEDEISIWLPG